MPDECAPRPLRGPFGLSRRWLTITIFILAAAAVLAVPILREGTLPISVLLVKASIVALAAPLLWLAVRTLRSVTESAGPRNDPSG